MNTTKQAPRRYSPLGIGIAVCLVAAVTGGVIYAATPHRAVVDDKVAAIVTDPFIARIEKSQGFDMAFTADDTLVTHAIVSANDASGAYGGIADLARSVSDALRDSHPPIKKIVLQVRQLAVNPLDKSGFTPLAVITFPAAGLESADFKTLSNERILDMATAFKAESDDGVMEGAYYCQNQGQAARHFCALIPKDVKDRAVHQ